MEKKLKWMLLIKIILTIEILHVIHNASLIYRPYSSYLVN